MLRSLFESIDDGFCVLDAILDDGSRVVDLRVLENNPALHAQLGVGDVAGKLLREIDPTLDESLFRVFEEVVRTGEPRRFVYEATPPTGARWFEVFAHRLGGEETTQVGVVFREVTARREAELRRERAEAELRESERRFAAIHDRAPFAVALARPSDHTIVSANDAFLRMFELGRDEVVGKPHVTLGLLEPEELARVRAEFRRVGVLRDFECTRRTRTADRRVLLVNLARIEIGGAAHVLATAQDITDRKRTEDALREAQARTDLADRRKSEFLAVLSHELRNPLAPIHSSLYVLERAAPQSEEASHAREILHRQAEHLTRLVDDLLDVTRIERGKVELKRARLDLREVVRKTTDDLLPTFEAHGVGLRVEQPPGPAWVHGDAVRLAQVLANLLQNAVKFTPSGGTVTVGLSTSGPAVSLSVRDTGEGVEAGELERMFEPFAQASQGVARTQGGLGLGLALVKGFVELHGGTVRASSAGRGRGAEFTVSLPPAETPHHRSDAGLPADPRCRPRDVLIIEDNVDAGQSLADVLRIQGHDVRVAADGRTGLALLRARPPDVVLCDIGLPDLDGYEVARAVRADVALSGTRLIALTGYAQPEDRQRATEVGFDAHLPKPASIEQLEHLLRAGTAPR